MFLYIERNYLLSVINSQLKTKPQIKIPLFPKFPAYGVFLLKRPKGTRSCRWARSLLYAWREFPHWTHPIHWPANHGGYRSSQEDGKTRPALEVLWSCIALDNRMQD